jgi:hypothetical protein
MKNSKSPLYPFIIRTFVVFLFLITFAFFSCDSKFPDYIYSKEIDSWSNAIKQQQRQNGNEFLDLLQDAKISGKIEINLDKRHYRFDGSENEGIIRIKNFDGLTINGNGAEFWFENYSTALFISDSKDIEINNISIDYDPLPFSQIIVTDIGETYLEGFTEKGFMTMDEIVARTGRNHIPRMKFFIFDPQTGLLKPDVAHNHMDSIVLTGEGHIRFYGRPFGGIPFSEMNIETGDRAAIIMRHAHGIAIRNSENIKFDGLNIYSSPMFGISMSAGKGPLKLVNSKLIPRTGTKRLMGTNGDALHFTSVKNGPLIDNCEISAPGDDVINMHGDFGLVQRQLAPDEVVIAVKAHRNIYEGSTLSFYHSESFQYKGSYKVISIEIGNDELHEDAKNVGKHIIHWPGNHSLICKLDGEIDLDRYYWVESDYDSGHGAIVRNNKISNATTRGIIVKTKNAIIENNYLTHIDNAAIAVFGSPIWGEGPFPENIIIRNNTIENCNFGLGARFRGTSMLGAISVGNYYRGELRENMRPIRNILIENNSITNSSTSGVFITHTDNCIIKHNSIDGYWTADPRFSGYNFGIEPFSAIYVADSENIEIASNDISNPGKYASDTIKLGKYIDVNSVIIK